MRDIKKTFYDFFQNKDMKREFKEWMYPIIEIIYNEIYIYLWLICIYNLFLFILICIILLLLLKIFRRISKMEIPIP